MNGTPEAEITHLRQLVLELQAAQMVADSRWRGLRHFVLEICRLVNVKDVGEGRPLDEVLRGIVDAELDARLAKVSDDDPRHAAFLKQFIRAAKSKPQ